MYEKILETHQITRGNFEKNYPRIEDRLRTAQFVCFDAEFTGAPRKNSTWKLDGMNDFETPEKIYANLKQDANSLIIIQLGITAFYFNPTTRKYDASTFSFYVFPQSLPAIQKSFGIHASVMEMLSSLNFDFNKVVYEGITCLNEKGVQDLNEVISSNSILGHTKRPLSMEDDRFIQDKCSAVMSWESTAKVGDSMDLDHMDYSKKLVVFLLIQKIHAKYPNLWTFKNENNTDPSISNTLRIEKVSELKRGELQSQAIKYQVFEKELMKHFLGVSRIFKLLIEMKKPIVGSGVLFDLMMMFQQFHKQLPESYAAFKSQLTALLPLVWDTRHITYCVRERCRRSNIAFDDANGLRLLDVYFRPGCGARLPPAHPAVSLDRLTSDAPATIGQDAGWDSYYTGCCFLRMAYFLAGESRLDMTLSKNESNFKLVFNAEIMQYKNVLHVSPATVDFIRLDGADPPAERPRRLALTSASQLVVVSQASLYRDLAESARGSLRVEMRGAGRARATVNSRRAASEVALRCADAGYAVADETGATGTAVKRTVCAGGVIGFVSILLWKTYRLLR